MMARSKVKKKFDGNEFEKIKCEYNFFNSDTLIDIDTIEF